ncbi:MAG: hypothetical protein J0M02_11330 [Planctomycetes bacterium]|nr:hypothetical protein [Planctomycetota bacterium]
MANELERIVGILGDIADGDGTAKLAALIDCPVCGKPLDLLVDHGQRTLSASCPADAAHFSWRGGFTELPGWIDRYSQLNR